ncbi:MAG: thioredoxin [Alphaproteobacteria bacterium]|nr:thioredoxin [Alphaproteobacteria bacterium]
MMLEVNNTNFEQEVLKSDKPVVVDFSAVWCGSCRQIAPFVAQIADEMANDVKIVHIDVDEAEQIALKYDVQSLPTLMMFKQGQAVAAHVGAAGKNDLADWIKANI